MYNMRKASDDLENQFGLLFLRIPAEQLLLINLTAQDDEFNSHHPRLSKYLDTAISYRYQQIESGMEDACSVQDLRPETWRNEELANAVVGLERLQVLSQRYKELAQWTHVFDRLIVVHICGRLLGGDDLKKVAAEMN
ncbi:hypothetical protein [uncultured Rubinisphaera sp.]|uniref:hypothetical protein n=1 Tax=uncultured Rubinisphaera sp. TaxID=1678686 RepID=UPI0030DC08EB|tara:strand:+ start:513 stop:926 length:414 start_codon:yes stop_codon:yes gene_type:complete